ncbi:sodium channel protein Nach-like [Diabrotica undecimpunctata]|uniref:sodium channel protein Nach-like n=1 Tax=Diabrotica undecimpunctata TaxID=50387 RepID=UPI003B6374CA
MRKRLQYYGKESNLHALKYIANETKSWPVRLFWVFIFVTNFGAMLLVFWNSYKQFEESAVSFVTETTYLTWNTTFPAISICPIAGAEPEWVENEEFVDEEIDVQKQFISDVVYFTGNCYSCYEECESCKHMNFTQKVLRYRKDCTRLISSCKWKDASFSCCDHFLPVETEYGICYSFNSMHTRKNGRSDLDLTMNRKTGPGEIWLQTMEDVRVYFHALEDVPFINSDPDQRRDVMLGESVNITISVIEIDNDENVKNVPVYKRGCKFPWENEHINVHKYYSYSTCVVQCHAENHVKLCNCTHHLMPFYNKMKYCDVDGLKCLTDNFEIVNRLHAKGTSLRKPGLVCDCLPSCVEPEYKVVSITKGLKSDQSEILINIIGLPSTRFKRIVLRTTLDLVVSIGGAAGLFIGASLLSIVEILYLLCFGEPKKNRNKKLILDVRSVE